MSEWRNEVQWISDYFGWGYLSAVYKKSDNSIEYIYYRKKENAFLWDPRKDPGRTCQKENQQSLLRLRSHISHMYKFEPIQGCPWISESSYAVTALGLIAASVRLLRELSRPNWTNGMRIGWPACKLEIASWMSIGRQSWAPVVQKPSNFWLIFRRKPNALSSLDEVKKYVVEKYVKKRFVPKGSEKADPKTFYKNGNSKNQQSQPEIKEPKKA